MKEKEIKKLKKELNELRKCKESIEEGKGAFLKEIERRGYNKAQEEFKEKLEQLKKILIKEYEKI